MGIFQISHTQHMWWNWIHTKSACTFFCCCCCSLSYQKSSFFVTSNIVFIIWRRFRNMFCWKFNLTIFFCLFVPSNNFSFFFRSLVFLLFSGGWSINFHFNKKKKKKVQIYFQNKTTKKDSMKITLNVLLVLLLFCRPFYHTNIVASR